MGKYIDAKCKLCRREGTKLFLKGERCHSAKCSLIKRKYAPGIHGPKGGSRPTGYGIQLRAKQKAKRIYNLREEQFVLYYNEAKKKEGDAGQNLLQILETRLDNVIYRAGLAESRQHARQMVTHSFFKVNNKTIDIPSYLVKVGDIIELKPGKKDKKNIKKIEQNPKKDKKLIPAWITVDDNTKHVKILNLPTQDDLVEKLDDKLIIEFYSRL